MMRRSGVRSRAWISKVSRDTPRRAASGHRPSRQVLKFAAAARIASAVMSGWPELPDCPLQSGAPEPFGSGTEPVTAGEAGARNGNSRSTICAVAPAVAAARAPPTHAAPISDFRSTIAILPHRHRGSSAVNTIADIVNWRTILVDGGLTHRTYSIRL